jgi:hypothetical protein
MVEELKTTSISSLKSIFEQASKSQVSVAKPVPQKLITSNVFGATNTSVKPTEAPKKVDNSWIKK